MFSVLPYGCITYRHMSDDNIFHFNINRLVANGLVSKEYPVFTVRKEVLDTDFLVDTLNSSPLFSVFCIQQKKGGTRTRLYFKTLCSYQMFLPVLHEQQVIASFIRLLDKRIERQMELVETLKKYKRGLLSNAFRNASSWRKKRLGEICCIRTGKLDANAMVNDGKYPFFTCARERYSIDTYAFDTDALLISGNGANVGYIHHYTGKFNAYQRTYVLDQFQEDINYVHVFLNRFLSSRIDAEKKAGNTPYIVLSTLSDMEIYIPDETTTKQLVDLFTQIENRISYSATVLEYLSSQRRGLLQQLFI